MAKGKKCQSIFLRGFIVLENEKHGELDEKAAACSISEQKRVKWGLCFSSSLLSRQVAAMWSEAKDWHWSE